MVPFEGIIAGPFLGASAAFIGVVVGRFSKPEFFFVENFFGIAEPAGAFAAGLLFTKRWKIVAAIYLLLLGVFFLHPLARLIPMWTLWDIYVAFFAIFPAAVVVRRTSQDSTDIRSLFFSLALVTFVSVELDVLIRVFMLTVLGLYQAYPIPTDLLPEIFIAGALTTPLEAAYAVVACTLVGVPLMISLEKSGLLRLMNSDKRPKRTIQHW